MIFSYTQVAIICLVYLGIVFSIAYSTEQGWIPNKFVTHPITYVFALGIFASAWSYYGIIELASHYGYGALTYYAGTGGLFLFGAYALKPLVELAKRFQITSMADLLVFRYHSHSVGAAITALMLAAMIPLLVLQLQAVTDTIHLLTHRTSGESEPSGFGVKQSLALVYCAVIAIFATAFGSNREHHKGLVVAMAFESLIKMAGLLAVGAFALYGVFDGMSGLDAWLIEHPEQLNTLKINLNETPIHTLLLVFIATAVSMPHIFHMTVVENPTKSSHNALAWAFPLFLLFMALPIFPIMWAGQALDLVSPTQYFPLSIPLFEGNPTFTIIAFVGGLAAATGAMVAIALALSTMILNHWILPTTQLRVQKDVYRQLIWMRRSLIAFIVLAGYGFYLVLNNHFTLTQLAFPSFIATLQLLPGVVGVTHWTKGNRKGLVAGLVAGGSIWFIGLMYPLFIGETSHELHIFGTTFSVGTEHWSAITIWSLGCNSLLFLLISLLTRQNDDERYSAELCSQDELSHPVRLTLDIRSPNEIIERLSTRIGASTAQSEVNRALNRLGLHHNESRPYALRRLRDEVEANLSSLIGIAMASEILDRLIPYKVPEIHSAKDINLIESRLNQVRDHLTGLAAELNNLRLYHRRTLEQLPLATCSIGQDLEILMWNSAMAKLTGIDSNAVTGSHVRGVKEPWGSLLHKFANSNEPHFYKQQVELDNHIHWITLHKATIPSTLSHQVDGQVILLEDVTELQLLEQELLHSERLASIGRLAAGVAHEIGNPVTGIACLAQNMLYDTEDPELLESADQILSQTKRVSRIVESLVSFSHAGQQSPTDFENVNLRDCAQEAINLLSLQKEKRQVVYENQIPSHIVVRADSQRLIQVFINLLSNSRDASPPFGQVVLTAEVTEKSVKFSVTDYGSGIPSEHLDRIFEPFFTTKEPGEGTGLGLAMVYSIIEDHQGGLEIESPAHPDTQNGTRFIITLPLTLASQGRTGNTNN